MSGTGGYRYAEITAALADDAERLAEHLHGKPTSRGRGEWRWGRKGSLRLQLKGKKRGFYSDFESGQTYGPIRAIAMGMGMEYQDAARWAALDFLRWPDQSGEKPSASEQARREESARKAETERQRKAAEQEAEAEAEEQARIDEVLGFWRRGVPIKGTPAETYLRNRSIHSEAWPETLRWHPSRGWLMAASMRPEGDVTALQRIAINADGSPVKREDGSKVKLSLGPRYGGATRFPGDPGKPLVICEGVETALSVWWATGHETWAALGIVAGVDLQAVALERKVVICPDDDARNAQTVKAMKKAVRAWRLEGRTVLMATPWIDLKRDKSDMNDALQAYGPKHIRDRIQAALTPRRDERAADAASLSSARMRLQKAMAEALEMCRSNPSAQIGIRIDVGGGKTHAAVAEALRWIKQERDHLHDEKGDCRGMKAVVMAVPTHRLGAELEERIRKEAKAQRIQIDVATWRGREAADPHEPGETMCRNLEAVKAAQKALADVQSTVCQDKEGNACPFYSSCQYQRQRQEKAHIWIVPHAALFHQRPAPIGDVGLLIIDESFHQSALRGFGPKPIAIGMDTIERSPTVHAWSKTGDIVMSPSMTADLVAELNPIREKLVKALALSGDGHLKREAIIRAGLTAEEARSASGLEWHRKLDPSPFLTPRLARNVLADRAGRIAQINEGIPRMARMWTEIAEMLNTSADASGRISVATVKGEGGEPHKAVVLRWMDSIAQSWEAPTVHIDATLRPDLVRPLLPRLEMVADIAIKAPHQRTIAVVGKSFSHSALRDEKAVQRLWRQVKLSAALTDGETLVIMPKAVEQAVRALEPIPSHVHILHHGAVAGLDAYGKVARLITIGRTLPAPSEVEAIAGAMTGQAAERIGGDGWYRAETVTVEDARGQAVSLPREYHPDRMAEAVRASILEDQLIQGIGRGRGVNRTAADPLTVEIWNDTLPPVPVEEIWQHIPLTHDEQAMAEGVWLESAPDLSALHPSMKVEAIRKGRKQRTGYLSYIYIYTKSTLTSPDQPDAEEMTSTAQAFLAANSVLALYAYKKAGPGQKPKVAVVDRRVCPDPHGVLTEALGPLAMFAQVNWPARPDHQRPAPQEAPQEAPEADPVEEVLDILEEVESPPAPAAINLEAGPWHVQKEDVGRTLRYLSDNRMTITHLPDLIGISPAMVGHFVKGEARLPPDQAARLMELIGPAPTTSALQ